MTKDKLEREIALKDAADSLMSTRVSLLFHEAFDNLDNGFESATFLAALAQIEVAVNQLRMAASVKEEI